jgi:hypothetical protein
VRGSGAGGRKKGEGGTERGVKPADSDLKTGRELSDIDKKSQQHVRRVSK